MNILSKLGKQGLEWRVEPEAFTGREVRREDDLLGFRVGCPVDIEVARQPSQLRIDFDTSLPEETCVP